MTELTPEQQALRDANPDERSPRLRINREDPIVVQALADLRDQWLRANRSRAPFRAPESRYDRDDVQGPPIITALFEKGEVNLWALARQSPGYPTSGANGFNDAVELIRGVDGVELVEP